MQAPCQLESAIHAPRLPSLPAASRGWSGHRHSVKDGQVACGAHFVERASCKQASSYNAVKQTQGDDLKQRSVAAVRENQPLGIG